MLSKLTRFVGSQAARQAVRQQSGTGGALDIRFGMQLLLRDKRIPILHKLLALGLGGVLTWLLITAEFPLETIIAAFLPVVGFMADALADGAEAVIFPVLLAALVLPYLAPRTLVDEARMLHLQTIPVR